MRDTSLKVPLVSSTGKDNLQSSHVHENTNVDATNVDKKGGSCISESGDNASLVHRYGSCGPDNFSPKPQGTSCFVILLTFLATCGSFLFGYDTGVVSGAMLFLREDFELTEVQQEAVVAVTIAAAAMFSLVAGFLNQILGRKITILIASVSFVTGSLVLGFAVNLAMLIVGRLVVGIGIGLASMTVPVYIAECSPPASRGSLVTIHQLMITIGMLSANLLAAGFSYIHQGWRYMLGLGAVPALFQLVAFLFVPESPRWLVKAGKVREADEALRKIRGGGNTAEEFEIILQTCKKESEEIKVNGVFRRMFKEPYVRRALLIGCGLQMFQQIAGVNTVMYYTATIMKMAGIQDNSLAIWLSCAIAGCNVFISFFAVYWIDKLGRKPLLVSSFIGVLVSLVVLAIGFQLAADHTAEVNLPSSDQCSSFLTCDSCITEAECGFCYVEVNGTLSSASCLITAGKYSENSASGNCSQSKGNISGSIWAYDFCPSQYAWITLLGMIMYIICFAPGLAPVPWTFNSEIYPLWARSAGNALSTATNWTFNLIIAMSFLTLTSTLTKYGTYWLYSGLAFVGVIFVAVLVPETKGRSLEQIESAFSKSWIVWP